MNEYLDYDPIEKVDDEDRPRFAWKLVLFVALLVCGLTANMQYQKWLTPPRLTYAPRGPECLKMPCQPTGWSIVSGQLPTGLTMNASGRISGTPKTSGTFTVTTVSPLPNGVQGVPYTFQFQSVPGVVNGNGDH